MHTTADGRYRHLVGRLYKTEGIILKSTSFGEGHLLITLIAKNGAKVRAIVWGSRKLTSRKSGHVEPLTRVDLTLSQGRDLDTVNQAQALESFGPIKSNLQATAKAIYLAELVDGFANEGNGNTPLYRLFLNALRMLEYPSNSDVSILYFQLNLLNVTGFMPELYQCVECRRQISQGGHRFCIDLGGIVCDRCVLSDVRISPISLRAIKVLRFFDRGAVTTLTTLRLPAPLYQELRSVLDGSIRYWLDREVRSREFMDHMERQAADEARLRV